MKNIIVVGSLNADLVQAVPRVPHPGETLIGHDLQIVAGGKGGNQAFAAGQLGGRASMIGNVGTDAFAELLIKGLQAGGVDTKHVVGVEGATGTACILVMPDGENVIVVSPGANGRLSAKAVGDRLNQALAHSAGGAIVLCQLEIPLESVVAALTISRRAGAVTMLDPAPAQALGSDTLTLVDFLTPNQSEAATLLGHAAPISSVADALAAAQALLQRGPAHVIVKMGKLGCVLATAETCEHITGFQVEVRDTTAAGDTFNGGFAAALTNGRSIIEAVRFAHAAAAISVTRFGAQSSIPTSRETEEFIASESRDLGMRT